MVASSHKEANMNGGLAALDDVVCKPQFFDLWEEDKLVSAGGTVQIGRPSKPLLTRNLLSLGAGKSQKPTQKRPARLLKRGLRLA